MVQVLRATPREKRKSFSERLNEGIASGLDIAESYILQNEKKKEDEALRTTAERLSGQDLSGVSGDVIRQSFGDILKQAGREKEQQTKIEGIRNAFKKGNPLRENPSEQFAKNIVENTPRNQALEFTEELNQPRNQQFNDQINNQNISEGEGEFGDYKRIEDVPDSIIAEVTLLDREYGKSLRKAKDAALQERSYEERTRSQQEERDYQRGLKEEEKVRQSFQDNKEYINKTYDKSDTADYKEALLDRQDQLDASGELSAPGTIVFLESIGIQPEWLQNPSNDEYNKLTLDLLGGGTLQQDYGNRILASEFKVAMQRVPTLMQTPEGRKQIRENIRYTLLPAKLRKERLAYYLDKQARDGKPLPHDLRGTIDRDIKPQLQEANDRFKQRNGRYKVIKGTIPDDNDLEKYYFLGNGDENKILKMMEEDGYDVGSTNQSASRTNARPSAGVGSF